MRGLTQAKIGLRCWRVARKLGLDVYDRADICAGRCGPSPLHMLRGRAAAAYKRRPLSTAKISFRSAMPAAALEGFTSSLPCLSKEPVSLHH
jgi:hypothetical protein